MFCHSRKLYFGSQRYISIYWVILMPHRRLWASSPSLPLLYQLRKERERLRAMMAHLHLPSLEGQPLSAPTSLQSPQSDTAADPRGPQVDSVPCSNSRMNNRHKANEPWSVSKSEPNMWWRVKITCFCPQVRLPQRWWRCCQPVTDLVDFYSWMSCRNMLALS